MMNKPINLTVSPRVAKLLLAMLDAGAFTSGTPASLQAATEMRAFYGHVEYQLAMAELEEAR